MDSRPRATIAPTTVDSISNELVVSTVLFLGTVLFTQFATASRRSSSICWRRKCRAALLRILQEGDDAKSNDNREESYEYSRQESYYPSFGTGLDSEEDPYVYRRMHSRLSFHGDDDLIHLPPSLLPGPSPSTKLTPTPSKSHSSRHISPKAYSISAGSTTPVVLEENEEAFVGESDFYPKNANWSHFDLTELWHKNQQQSPDIMIKKGQQTSPASSAESTLLIPSKLVPHPNSPVRRQVSLEGDSYYNNHTSNRSNHNSDISSPQFVWTAAMAYNKNNNKGRHHSEPTLGSKQRVPSTSSSSSHSAAAAATTAAAAATTTAPSPRAVTTEATLTATTQDTPISKSNLCRAESLDDRTVWGHHTDDNAITKSQESEPATDKRISFADMRPKKSDHVKPQGFTNVVPSHSRSDASCRSSQQEFLARRSQSVPDLAAHFAQNGSIKEYDRDLAASVRRQNTKARARYNACIMPHSVILIRHGQSMGNINEELYSTIPDNAMPLTKLGWEQARASGRILRQLLSDRHQSPHFIVSPYVRTVETFHGLVSAWCDPSEFQHITDREARLAAWYSRLLELGLTWHEDPRIREQDFGNYQNASVIKQAKRDRHRFGAFYYRFPHGESASDVFDRISTFLDSLWRSFDVNKSRIYVLVTHGIAIRVLLARYFRYTISQFSMLANPRNGEMVVLRHDGRGRLKLAGRYELELQRNDEEGELHVVGVAYHQRLKVLPPEYIRKVPIRISYDDEDDDE